MKHLTTALLLAACLLAAACERHTAPPAPPLQTAELAADNQAASLPSLQLEQFAIRAPAVVVFYDATQGTASPAAEPATQAQANHTEHILDMVGVARTDSAEARPPLLEHKLIIGRLRADRDASQQVALLARFSHSPRSTVWLC